MGALDYRGHKPISLRWIVDEGELRGLISAINKTILRNVRDLLPSQVPNMNMINRNIDCGLPTLYSLTDSLDFWYHDSGFYSLTVEQTKRDLIAVTIRVAGWWWADNFRLLEVIDKLIGATQDVEYNSLTIYHDDRSLDGLPIDCPKRTIFNCCYVQFVTSDIVQRFNVNYVECDIIWPELEPPHIPKNTSSGTKVAPNTVAPNTAESDSTNTTPTNQSKEKHTWLKSLKTKISKTIHSTVSQRHS